MLDIPKEEMMTSGSTTCNQGPPKVSCTVINLFSNSFFFLKKGNPYCQRLLCTALSQIHALLFHNYSPPLV